MQFVTGDHASALSVPRGAVMRMGGKATVWVASDDRAEPREVTVGLENADRVEILAGLQGGERVVASGQDGLYAGARVASLSDGAPAGLGVTSPQEARAGEPAAQTAASGHTGHGAGIVVAQAGGAASPAGKLQIALTSNPVTLTSGNATLRIEVKDAAGAPVSDAKVEVNIGMPGMTVPKATARAAKEPGVYEATAKLGMAGAWTVEVTATHPLRGSNSAKFNLEAK
jgi:nitrogen fixation protein FixH